jgi:transcriptional regulator with XRE-family HTH domain
VDDDEENTTMRLKLREARERRFLTQQALADLVGTTKANISRLETGNQRPRPGTVLRLAEALGVPPEELVDWEAGTDTKGAETGKAAA